MERRRFNEEQIMKALKSNEEGIEVAGICRELDIDEQTFYCWRTKYSGMEVAEVERMRETESENAKPKELLVESDPNEAAFSQGLLTKGGLSSEHIDQEDANNELEDYVDAIADFDEAIKLNPNNAGTYNNRGMVKNKLGDYAGAIADFDEVIKLDPNYITAYNSRGIVKRKLGDYADAIADFGEVIKLNPNDADTYNNQGIVKNKLEDYVGAIADYDQTIKFNPDYTAVHIKRKKLLRSINKLSKLRTLKENLK